MQVFGISIPACSIAGADRRQRGRHHAVPRHHADETEVRDDLRLDEEKITPHLHLSFVLLALPGACAGPGPSPWWSAWRRCIHLRKYLLFIHRGDHRHPAHRADLLDALQSLAHASSSGESGIGGRHLREGSASLVAMACSSSTAASSWSPATPRFSRRRASGSNAGSAGAAMPTIGSIRASSRCSSAGGQGDVAGAEDGGLAARRCTQASSVSNAMAFGAMPGQRSAGDAQSAVLRLFERRHGEQRGW